MTAQEIIEKALRELELLEETTGGNPVEQDRITDALAALNGLLEGWK